MGISYITREAVKLALDMKATARADGEVDAAISSSTESIHGLTHRRFYPWTGTRYMDWPQRNYGSSWRLWLDANEMASITQLVSGGTLLDPSVYFLRRSDEIDEAPYDQIQVDLGTSGSFSFGATRQRALELTGVFIGCPVTEVAAGALAEALDTAETSVDVTDSAAIGVGDIIRVETERMMVIGRSMLTTGQTLQTPLTRDMSAVTVAVTDGSAFSVGETLLLDGERMLVVDIAANTLVVKRAWDGSVLATHAGSTIFAARTLRVERGALGTTAATHDTATAVVRFQPPPLVSELALAESVNTLLQRRSGYARTIGSGENEREVGGRALRDIRADCRRAHGKLARVAAV